MNQCTKFGTDNMSQMYLGWLLGSADATKGGFGTAVTLPDTSTQLLRTKAGIVVTF